MAAPAISDIAGNRTASAAVMIHITSLKIESAGMLWHHYTMDGPETTAFCGTIGDTKSDPKT
jgi:hypothetical protein